MLIDWIINCILIKSISSVLNLNVMLEMIWPALLDWNYVNLEKCLLWIWLTKISTKLDCPVMCQNFILLIHKMEEALSVTKNVKDSKWLKKISPLEETINQFILILEI